MSSVRPAFARLKQVTRCIQLQNERPNAVKDNGGASKLIASLSEQLATLTMQSIDKLGFDVRQGQAFECRALTLLCVLVSFFYHKLRPLLKTYNWLYNKYV